MDKAQKKLHDDMVAKAKNSKPFAAGKYILRCKHTHPTRMYRALDIVVTGTFKEYELNEAQAKELSGEGCRAWIEHGTKKLLEADVKLKKVMGDLQNLDKEEI